MGRASYSTRPYSPATAGLEQLAANPFEAGNVKKFVGRNGYRLRVGDWRVIYEVQGDRLIIVVLATAPC
jgi:mRNA interferase RelE/StbE